MNQIKNVIILGKGSLAIKIANWFKDNPDYNIICVVPVIPEPTWTDSFKDWAIHNNIPIVKSGDYNQIKNVNEQNWEIDLCFSIFYDKIIKDWFIQKCKKILNLHNAPLPKYRGVQPINWALKNNEEKHGITIHEITPGIDDGPIISQLDYSIYPYFDEVNDVYKRALNYSWNLFEQTMPIIEKIIPKEQDESCATYYSKKQSDQLEERQNFTKESSK